MEVPNVFWKYYDLFRRKKITLLEFSQLSELQTTQITYFLENLGLEEKKDEKWKRKCYNKRNNV